MIEQKKAEVFDILVQIDRCRTELEGYEKQKVAKLRELKGIEDAEKNAKAEGK